MYTQEEEANQNKVHKHSVEYDGYKFLFNSSVYQASLVEGVSVV